MLVLLFPLFFLIAPFTQLYDWVSHLFVTPQQYVTENDRTCKTCAKKPVTAHIFIHGTRLPGLLILDPRAAIHHLVDDKSTYVKQLSKLRKDERFYEDQIMQEEGLVEITQKQIEQCWAHTLSANLRKRAAIHVIAGYDQFIDKTTQIPHYYTYGWVGVLDDIYRQKDAKQLYQTLINLRTKLTALYPNHEIQFVLHGHSHGGNLILYLARCEDELQQKLVIHHAGLYGTPIQKETAHYCLHACFRHIVVFYSRADKVQIADFLSVKSKTSCRRFSDLISWQPIKDHYIQEVCVSANGHPKAFGHADFFYLDEYRIHRIRRGIRPYHRTYQAINPLPIVFFAAIYLPLLQEAASIEPHNHHLKLDIVCNKREIVLTLQGASTFISSANIKNDIQKITNHFQAQWKPYTSFNYLNKTQWMMRQ